MQAMRRDIRGRRCFNRQAAGRRVNLRRGIAPNNIHAPCSVDQLGPTVRPKHNEATLRAVTTTVLPLRIFQRRFMAAIALLVTVTMARGDERVVGKPARLLSVRMMPTTPYQKMVEHGGHHQVVQKPSHCAFSSAKS